MATGPPRSPIKNSPGGQVHTSCNHSFFDGNTENRPTSARCSGYYNQRARLPFDSEIRSRSPLLIPERRAVAAMASGMVVHVLLGDCGRTTDSERKVCLSHKIVMPRTTAPCTYRRQSIIAPIRTPANASRAQRHNADNRRTAKPDCGGNYSAACPCRRSIFGADAIGSSVRRDLPSKNAPCSMASD